MFPLSPAARALAYFSPWRTLAFSTTAAIFWEM